MSAINNMRRGLAPLALAVAVACALGACKKDEAAADAGPAAAQQAPAATLSTEAEIAAEFASVPCDNSARLDATRALFERIVAAYKA